MALRGEGSLQRLLGKRVSTSRSNGSSSRSKAQRSEEEPAAASKNGGRARMKRSRCARKKGARYRAIVATQLNKHALHI